MLVQYLYGTRTWLPLSQLILTHWGRDKMAAIFQTTFFKGIFLYELKMYEFRLKFKIHTRTWAHVYIYIYIIYMVEFCSGDVFLRLVVYIPRCIKSYSMIYCRIYPPKILMEISLRGFSRVWWFLDIWMPFLRQAWYRQFYLTIFEAICQQFFSLRLSW